MDLPPVDPPLPSEFHTIIFGTGLVESLVAAALARAGKPILHLDTETHYGSADSCFQINDFLEYLTNHSKPEPAQKPSINNVEIIGAPETPFPPVVARKFSVDLSPKFVWSSGPFTDALVRSGVNRYLEFKPVDACMIALNGAIQPVPCSKGDIFKNKLISLVEKNKLMKFLVSIQSPSAADQELLAAHEEKPFIEFLKSRQLSDNLVQFILYSIALIQTNQSACPSVLTPEGIQLLGKFLRSSGRFGPTPFIAAIYGCSEIPQAFCRLAAVYGATYMLGYTTNKLILNSDGNHVQGIEDPSGKHISCQFVVSNSDHLPQYHGSLKSRVSRCIMGGKKAFGEITHTQLLIIPPNTFGNHASVTVLQYAASLNVTPGDTVLFHLVTESSESQTAKEDLQGVIEAFFEMPSSNTETSPDAPEATSEASSSSSTKITVDWCVYFNTNTYQESTHPANVFLVTSANPHLTHDSALEEAKALFAKICPEEEFIPEVPHPEDIIFEFPPEETKEGEQPTEGDSPENTDKAHDQDDSTPTNQESTTEPTTPVEEVPPPDTEEQQARFETFPVWLDCKQGKFGAKLSHFHTRAKKTRDRLPPQPKQIPNMARNEEKSHSMLNRWLQLEKGPTVYKERVKRPHLVELCHDVSECQKWRQQVLREIGKNVLQIQNASLEEHKIRDINDQINKLLREKTHWERRVKELGGPDISSSAPPIAENAEDETGAIRAPGGYYYFGAAKNLPGVKELLKPKKRDVNKRTRHELYQRIDTDYYGYRDDEDGLLEKLEAQAECEAREKAIQEWNRIAIEKYGSLEKAPNLPSKSEVLNERKAYVALPTQEEIEAEILKRKKDEAISEVLSQYL